MKKTLLLLLTIISCNVVVFGQKKTKQEGLTVQQINTEDWSFPQIDNYTGTYQFVVKAKRKFAFTTETFDLIENSRLENADVLLSLSSDLDVLILSRNKISESIFSPFTTTFTTKF